MPWTKPKTWSQRTHSAFDTSAFALLVGVLVFASLDTVPESVRNVVSVSGAVFAVVAVVISLRLHIANSRRDS